MAERYNRLFSLPQDLYTSGAPLVISAGALLKDSQTGSVLAQLKLRSLSDIAISAVQLQVVGYDMAKAEVCREEHQYLDLNVRRDEMFGAKEAIPLPVRSVRSFAVRVLAVFFSDGSRYDGTDEAWTPLPAQQDLNAYLYDAELIRQYRLETSEKSRFVPTVWKDLWLCSCGEPNRGGEPCFRCGLSLEQARQLLDVELLRKKKTERLETEALQRAEEERKKNSRSYKLRRLALILVPILLVAAIAFGVWSWSHRRVTAYNDAAALFEAGDYAAAAEAFDKLGKYQDAAERAAQARDNDAELSSYTRAGKLLENGRYDDAAEPYASLGSYRDSAERISECGYRKALEQLEAGAFAEAKALFEELGDYRDSAERAAHFFERELSETVSLDAELGGPLTILCGYDAKGQLVTRTELRSEYGKEDRVLSYAYAEDGSYSITEGQVERRYDPYGNYLGQGEIAAYIYDYGFNDDGSIKWAIANNPETEDYHSSISYDAQGNPTAIEVEDGTKIVVINDYNGDKLVKQERYATDGTLLERTTYEYDELGRIKRSSYMTPGASNAVTTSYTYGLLYLPEADS